MSWVDDAGMANDKTCCPSFHWSPPHLTYLSVTFESVSARALHKRTSLRATHHSHPPHHQLGAPSIIIQLHNRSPKPRIDYPHAFQTRSRDAPGQPPVGALGSQEQQD